MGGDAVLASDDPALRALVSARVEAALDLKRLLDDEAAVAIARRIGELIPE